MDKGSVQELLESFLKDRYGLSFSQASTDAIDLKHYLAENGIDSVSMLTDGNGNLVGYHKAYIAYMDAEEAAEMEAMNLELERRKTA